MICTIGHSTRTLSELVSILREHGIVHVVDVRTVPRSRTNPQFDADVLGEALARHGIGYELLPALGGLRGKSKVDVGADNGGWENESFRNYADYALTHAFEEGLARLLDIGEQADGNVAVMCAEAVWWRCHRRIIADHLLARGLPVRHLFDAHHAEAATLTPFAVVRKGRVTYPPSR